MKSVELSFIFPRTENKDMTSRHTGEEYTPANANANRPQPLSCSFNL